MNDKSKSREPIREILLGGAAGAILGGLVTFVVAVAITDSMMLAPIMAMQGAFTGAMGAGWAMAMLLVRADDEDSVETAEVVPIPVPLAGKRTTGLRPAA